MYSNLDFFLGKFKNPNPYDRRSDQRTNFSLGNVDYPIVLKASNDKKVFQGIQTKHLDIYLKSNLY